VRDTGGAPQVAQAAQTIERKVPEMVLGVSTAGWILIGAIALVIWVALAFWPARVAKRKGHSFAGYFLLSLLFFPLALLLAYMSHDRVGTYVRHDAAIS
jgi:energy-coupling factor transporter transmembrane protein EcfT